jgi:hypothetical protein
MISNNSLVYFMRYTDFHLSSLLMVFVVRFEVITVVIVNIIVCGMCQHLTWCMCTDASGRAAYVFKAELYPGHRTRGQIPEHNHFYGFIINMYTEDAYGRLRNIM